jgi:hypothetical protein
VLDAFRIVVPPFVGTKKQPPISGKRGRDLFRRGLRVCRGRSQMLCDVAG